MLLDVVQVFALDYSDGFTDPALGAVAIAAFATEVSLFSVALRRIDSAVAYGFYGLGTAIVATISIGWLGEPLTPVKGVALAAVILGAVLLNMDGSETGPSARPRWEAGRTVAPCATPRTWPSTSTSSTATSRRWRTRRGTAGCGCALTPRPTSASRSRGGRWRCQAPGSR
jgi:multidrug transporter EmrE-like cation transporter